MKFFKMLMFMMVALVSNAYADEATSPSVVTVPAGTQLYVEFTQTVDGRTMGAGTMFTAKLQSNIAVDGKMIAPAGSLLYGRVMDSTTSRSATGSGSLGLVIESVNVNGNVTPLVTSQYALKTESHTHRTFGRALKGAAIGALVDGGHGAETGAAIGAGASLLAPGSSPSVPQGSVVMFSLAAPLTVQVK